MNNILIEYLPNFLNNLGTIETHFLSLTLIHFVQQFSTKKLLIKALKFCTISYILSSHLLISLYRPFYEENIFRMTGLNRKKTSIEDIENMIGNLEDKFLGDEAKQEYINELEEKLLGDGRGYHLTADDYFGDQFKGLSFDGKISIQMEMKIGEVFADYIIFAYSTMIFFARGTSRIFKLLLLAVLVFFGYASYTIHEFGGDNDSLGKYLLLEIFKYPIFSQFCIFNVVQLAKNFSSWICCLLVVISGIFTEKKTDIIERNVRSVLGNGKETSLKDFEKVNEELEKVVKEKEGMERSNRKFIKIMIGFLMLSVVYFKGEELYKNFSENKKGK